MFNTQIRISKNEHTMKRCSALMGFAFLALALIMIAPAQVTAQETLTFSLVRNNGIGLGSSIQGLFTLHCTGPDTIENLTVYFNGVEVYFVESNVIAWQFVTDDYPSGDTNITLFGVDDVGGTYVGYQQVNFLGESISTAFTIGIIALVVILVIIRYVPRFLGRGDKKKSSS